MKLFILLTLFVSTLAHSQVVGDRNLEYTSATGADFNTNFILNPSARKNTSSTATSNAAIARVTTAGYKLDGVASYSCDASALSGYCEFTLDTIRNPADEGNCEFKGRIKGDGTLYQAQILDGSSNVLASTQVFGSQTLWTPFSVNYVCGSSRKVRVTQTVAGTAPVIYLGKLYYGSATNLNSSMPPNIFSAAISAAGVVSNETGGDFINGNCGVTSVSTYTCTFNSGFFTTFPNCVANPGTLANSAKMTSYSSSSIAYQTQNAAGTNTATDAFVTCTKAGSDNLQNAITAQNYDYEPRTETCTSSHTTNTVTTCKIGRKGGTAYGTITNTYSGAPNAVQLTWTLPATMTIDYTRLTSSGAFVSKGRILDVGTSGYLIGGATPEGATRSLTPYAGNASGAYVTDNIINATTPFTIGNTDVAILTFENLPITEWPSTQNAPQLLGSVTSNASGALRIESASVSSTGVVSAETSDWINGNCVMSGTGSATATCTWSTSSFAASPQCFTTSTNGATGRIISQSSVSSSAGVFVGQVSTTGAETASPFNLMCLGVR